MLVGGKRHSLGRTFYEPTILSDATDEMLIFRYEFLNCYVNWGTVLWLLNIYDLLKSLYFFERMKRFEQLGAESLVMLTYLCFTWRTGPAKF